jgi:D-galactarolactone cycloisomerase
MALHDLTARAYEIPLSSLLGGARRDRILAYASGPFFKPGGHPYRDFEREIDGYLSEGFRALKLRSGFNPADDVAAAFAARRQIGKEADLMIDFNQSCTPRRSITTASLMEEARLLWIEEPVTPTDLPGYRLAARQIKAAIAGGEAIMNPAGFLPFLADGCMDILQPDIAICGGLTGVGQVVALAQMFNRPVIPHVWGSTVNFHAALHLLSTLPNHRAGGQQPFPYLEYDVGPNPLLELAGRPRVNADGTVSVPEGPGLGIELNAAMLEPYIVARKTIAV